MKEKSAEKAKKTKGYRSLTVMLVVSGAELL